MKVKFHLPRGAQAISKFDELNNVLTVEPMFFRPDQNQYLAHVVVEGDNGAVRHFLLEINGTKGTIRSSQIAPVVAGFDKQPVNGEETADD